MSEISRIFYKIKVLFGRKFSVLIPELGMSSRRQVKTCLSIAKKIITMQENILYPIRRVILVDSVTRIDIDAILVRYSSKIVGLHTSMQSVNFFTLGQKAVFEILKE